MEKQRGPAAQPPTLLIEAGAPSQRVNGTHRVRDFTRTRRQHLLWSLEVPPDRYPKKRRQIIGKGSYLESGSPAARPNGVQLDPIKLMIGEDRDELPRIEFGPAHPSRGKCYSQPRLGAGNDAVG